MRVLVCGGRDFTDATLVNAVLTELVYNIKSATQPIIIHGDARGADTLAARWADEKGVPAESYPADWGTYGKAAGHIRNRKMLNTGIDLVIAFPGGRGTENMVRIAREAEVPVMEIATTKEVGVT